MGNAAARQHVRLEKKDAQGLPEPVQKALDGYFLARKAHDDKNDQLLGQLRQDAVTKEELKKIDEVVIGMKKAVDDAYSEIAALKRAAKSSNSGDTSDIEAKLDKLRRIEAKAFDSFVRTRDGSVDLMRAQQLASSDEYKSVLEHYRAELDLDLKDLSTVVAEDGGFLVLPEYESEMDEILLETSPIRQIANVRQIGTRELILPVNRKGTTVAWIGETGTRTATDTPTISQEKFTAHEIYAYPLVTLQMLEDATFDVEGWLQDEVVEALAIEENLRFVTGDGNGKPLGFLHDSVTKTAVASYDANTSWGTIGYLATGASGAFASAPNGADVLIDTVYDLKAYYRQNADWVMSRRTMAAIRKLKDSNGDYLIRDAITESGMVPMLLGYPILEAEDMPEIAANTYSIAFGDFNKFYQIVDRIGLQVRRDEITQPGFVKYHFRKRTGGGIRHYDAAKLVKFGTS